MTATEELRRLLDERGVEWWEASPCKTKWNSPVLGGPVAVREWNGKMVLDAGYENVTPEQAIDATLGRGTTARYGKFRTKYGRSVPCCEFCGYGIGDARWHYCPSCGAKVVD